VLISTTKDIKLEKLIIKYLANTLSDDELIELSVLLKKTKNKKLFQKRIRSEYDVSLAVQATDIEDTYQEILDRIKENEKRQKVRKLGWYRVAAVFVGILGMSYFFLFINEKEESVIQFDENAITLTLENGLVKVIAEDGEETIVDKEGNVVGRQEGVKLDYNNKTERGSKSDVAEELVYNELAIPYGKTFELVLSDGTNIHLNAGTTLKYPVKFIKGQQRQVFLDGEALFDVTKSKTQSFIVNTGELNVRVFGTKFNVNSYKEDGKVQTVLVEGSVGLYENKKQFNIDNTTMLAPKHIASWNKSNKNMQIEEVDTSEYTAWTEGKLLFKIRPFSEIIKVLERHYDVSIVNNYKRLNTQRFFAKFDIETIEQVLTSFQQSESFVFERKGNVVTINKTKL